MGAKKRTVRYLKTKVNAQEKVDKIKFLKIFAVSFAIWNKCWCLVTNNENIETSYILITMSMSSCSTLKKL